MRTIPLTQGRVALVDDCIFDYLNNFKWYAEYERNVKRFYAIRTIRHNGKRERVYMHRAALEFYGHDLTGLQTGHLNRDTLDNQISNIEPRTTRQNAENRKSNT